MNNFWRGLAACTFVIGTTAAIIMTLYTVKDAHIGISNVCLKIYAECM